MSHRDQLRLFLFLLQRDHLPVGVVEKVLKEVEDCRPPVFDSHPMELLVDEQTTRLIGP